MPIAFVWEGAEPRRVPLVRDPFVLGRGARSDLVLNDERIGLEHARVRRRQGDLVLDGLGSHQVFVNGRRVPLMALRDGDRVHLSEPGSDDEPALRLEHKMQDAFVPPGASLTRAWVSHPAFRAEASSPARYGEGRRLGSKDPARCRLVEEPGTGRTLVLKILGPARTHEEGDHHFALLASLTGAPHPALASVVDGGVSPVGDDAVRWLASAWVEGNTAQEIISRDGFVDPAVVLGALQTAAAALAHLHDRGVIHRDVTPSNLVVSAGDRGVLIDPGHARRIDDPPPKGSGVIGTPGYVAPEAVLADGPPLTPAADVYGLAGVGYAMLTGGPPAAGEDVLEALARATAIPPRPSDLGVDIPEALESMLLAALHPDPVQRPGARQFERTLGFARVALGVGGDT